MVAADLRARVRLGPFPPRRNGPSALRRPGRAPDRVRHRHQADGRVSAHCGRTLASRQWKPFGGADKTDPQRGPIAADQRGRPGVRVCNRHHAEASRHLRNRLSADSHRILFAGARVRANVTVRIRRSFPARAGLAGRRDGCVANRSTVGAIFHPRPSS